MADTTYACHPGAGLRLAPSGGIPLEALESAPGVQMPRSTNISRSTTTPASKAGRAAEPRASMSDAERAERGRAQIAAGQYLDDDRLDLFLDSLQITATKA